MLTLSNSLMLTSLEQHSSSMATQMQLALRLKMMTRIATLLRSRQLQHGLQRMAMVNC
jgi:hypothetical protein